MSEIIVKQLAQIVGTPIDTMLQQLQDAGIPVSSADDAISDSQKLLLLEHIRKGQQSNNLTTSPTETHVKPTLTMGKQRSAGRNKSVQSNKSSVTVGIRRPKTKGTATQSQTQQVAADNDFITNKGQQFTDKLGAERRALENVKRKTAPPTPTPTMTKVKQTPITTGKETLPVTENKITKSNASIEIKKPTKEKPVTTASSHTTEPSKIETVKTKTPENKIPNKTEKTIVKPKKQENKISTLRTIRRTPAPRRVDTSINFFEAARKHKENSAKNALDEAASQLKRRPSRKVIKAKVTPPAAQPAVTPSTVKTTTTTSTTTQNSTATAKNKKKKKIFQGRNAQVGSSQDNRRRRKGGKRRVLQPRIERSDKHGFEKPTAPVIKTIEVPETIILADLAQKASIQSTELIKKLMGMGVMATINQTLDQDTAILVIEELGHKAVPFITQDEDEALLATIISDNTEYETHSRPPVVTIMGHVDHGKTSLLDYIRESRVTAGEAGGITQHIGAYHVDTPSGTITFLDTPGHAAFSSMRARGSQATDIVIIVVAADDSVMPQTKEAIKHARAAGVPIIIAINKIDKENADPERVKSDLSALEVIPEEWGGEDLFVNVSAITGEGIETLLDSILLIAEMQELKAPIEGAASGLVIEASIEKGRGAVATVLIQNGTLKTGDIVLCGREYGRVRAMLNDIGKPTKSVGPSMPVSILGLSGAPNAGDEMLVVSNERKAREIAEVRRHKERESRLSAQQAAKLEALFASMGKGEVSQLNILIKADVQGSVEALSESLLRLSTDEVKVNIVSSGVGGINEGDANLANAANAVIIAFNVRADATARRTTSESGVDIRYYSIIYEAIDDVRDALSGLLAPELREEFVGLASVKDVFRSSSLGPIAGCLIIDGTIKQGHAIRVLRDNVVIYEGELESLRRHKDNVNEVHTGTECGIGVKNYNDIKAGDQIECFKRTEVARTLPKA
ncbi:MAG TPA: translation initiation factor IF-2 [Thiothrix sp.]|nr:translation initiation factor IF-2 [Thiothrix sp.]